MRSILRHLLGWGSLVLGIAGLLLPVLPGWLFIGVGALLLAPDVPVFRHLALWIERRFPASGRALEKLHRHLGNE